MGEEGGGGGRCTAPRSRTSARSPLDSRAKKRFSRAKNRFSRAKNRAPRAPLRACFPKGRPPRPLGGSSPESASARVRARRKIRNSRSCGIACSNPEHSSGLAMDAMELPAVIRSTPRYFCAVRVRQTAPWLAQRFFREASESCPHLFMVLNGAVARPKVLYTKVCGPRVLYTKVCILWYTKPLGEPRRRSGRFLYQRIETLVYKTFGSSPEQRRGKGGGGEGGGCGVCVCVCVCVCARARARVCCQIGQRYHG